MKLSLKAYLIKALAAGTLAGVVALGAPAKAEAQGFGLAVHIGNPYPVAYGPRYDDSFRRDDWQRHEAWIRQQEWLRHQEWERAHHVYGGRAYGPYATPYFGGFGR